MGQGHGRALSSELKSSMTSEIEHKFLTTMIMFCYHDSDYHYQICTDHF